MKITRRTFLAGAAVIAGAGALPMPRPARAALFDRQRLRIPELLDARSLGRSLGLTAQAGETAFFPGIASSTLGYNGAYLGPTIFRAALPRLNRATRYSASSGKRSNFTSRVFARTGNPFLRPRPSVPSLTSKLPNNALERAGKHSGPRLAAARS